MFKGKRVTIVIAARMGSTRLPGKCLMELAGKPLIEWLLLRVRRSRLADRIVLATTDRKEDAAFDRFADDTITVFHGHEHDLIDRHLNAAPDADVLVRITGDNPFTDPEWIDRAVEEHVTTGAQLTTTREIDQQGTVISHLPKGLSIDVFERKTLAHIHEKDDLSKADREHVLPYFFKHKNEYKIHFLDIPQCFRRPDIALSIDTAEDLAFVRHIADRLPDIETATLDEIFVAIDRCSE